ncbi:uncharacterized protein AB675_5655 [Cyphellophora attinorum]|uniref:Uncharacterized protein n=1 Tax=Cyphellophora attinorum TaxID=1664694 RepID=A0A0N1HCJ5_9EURO|nr:uncharacterized protein AB675_5655 [Phialophora attinorum]KPI42095.1 hypothetical protein AB675_5655 [Phialophora attinorum]
MDNTSTEHLTAPASEALQSFTATGRSYSSPTKADKSGRAWNAYATAEALGNGAPNLLPVRFTDESLIDVPVMRPEDVARAGFVGRNGTSASQISSDVGSSKKDPLSSRFSFLTKRRGSSDKKKDEFVMKQMTRAEYLKHYAKDAAGRYCGTGTPAEDCILRSEEDLLRWRNT